jgi:hypothetical protein
MAAQKIKHSKKIETCVLVVLESARVLQEQNKNQRLVRLMIPIVELVNSYINKVIK